MSSKTQHDAHGTFMNTLIKFSLIIYRWMQKCVQKFINKNTQLF